jgi:hypothetical protein
VEVKEVSDQPVVASGSRKKRLFVPKAQQLDQRIVCFSMYTRSSCHSDSTETAERSFKENETARTNSTSLTASCDAACQQVVWNKPPTALVCASLL